MVIISIIFGGALGALARYLLSVAINNIFSHFYMGTLFCNILGSFLAGFLFPLLKPNSLEHLFVFIGFLGSLSTFSTYSLESLQLLQKGKYIEHACHGPSI